MSNIVSKTTLKYQFTLVQKIEDLQLKADSVFSGVLNLNKSSVDAEEEENLKFIVTVGAGSHVEYMIDYGDGHSDTKPSPILLAKNSVVFFTHQYDIYGKYDVNITAFNLIHSVFYLYETSIHVYETVDSVSFSVKMVNYDQQLYGGSIFDKSSEVFALLFGTPATIQ